MYQELVWQMPGEVNTKVCRIKAPCKINLHLGVKNRRGDGFHEIESLFAALDLADTLEFEVLDRARGLEFVQHISGDSRFFEGCMNIPQEKNLVCRAVSLFREKTGFDRGLKVVLTKRIPSGAGLGGGSSDAASTLMALDKLSGNARSKGDSQRELMKMAETLGSDVPFFINGGAAWVTGRGEILEKTEIPPGLWVLLVKPCFSVSTVDAYAALDRSRAENKASPFTSCESIDSLKLHEILTKAPEDWPFYNDFLPVMSRILPEAAFCEKMCTKLKNEGAAFAGLSGSGSTCFGIFTKRAAAEKTLKKLQINEYFINLSFFIANKPEPVLH